MTKWLVRCFIKNYSDIKNTQVRANYGKMAGWVGIVCNIILFFAKLVVGILSGSISITADAVNNLSDASSSVITLLGFKMAAKPADAEHPFGHARIEYISGLAVAIMVILIGIELIKSSVEKIFNPSPVSYTIWSYSILIFSILLKIWMAKFNLTLGKKINSATLKATFTDSRNDVITTAAVLISAIIAGISGLNLDGYMGFLVAIFILYSGICLIKETLNPLLGQAPDPTLVNHIDEKINSYEGVLGTHDLIVHDYGPGRRYASAHVEMSSQQDVLVSHDIIDNIEHDFLQNENIHLIIHYDPIVVGNEQVDKAKNYTLECVRKINPKLTIHDFRIVEGPTHINYIFDIRIPDDLKMQDNELKETIQKNIQHGKLPINTVITLDKYYTTNGK